MDTTVTMSLGTLLKRKVITHTDSSKHQRLLLTGEGRGGEGSEWVSIDQYSFCCLQNKVGGSLEMLLNVIVM